MAMLKKMTLSLSAVLLIVGILFVSSISAQAQSNSDEQAISTCLTFSHTLGYHSTDANTEGQVTDLQDFLIANNYLDGSTSGFFGLKTVAAVKKFQIANGINQTGAVGSITGAKIKAITCVAAESSLPNTSSSSSDLSALQAQIVALTKIIASLKTNQSLDNLNSSSAAFEISSPKGSETWLAGNTYVITWRGQATGNVSLYFDQKGGNRCAIVSTPVSTESYSLYLQKDYPCFNSVSTSKGDTNGYLNDGEYGIYAYTDSGPSDSVGPIMISGVHTGSSTGGSPSFIWALPQVPAKWTAGNTYSAAWRSTGYTGNVSLILLSSGKDILSSCTIGRVPVSSGQFSFALTADSPCYDSSGNIISRLSAGSYELRASLDNYPGSAWGIGPITIDLNSSTLPPTVTITSPNGGESWVGGNNYTITWTKTGETSNVLLELVAVNSDGSFASGTTSWGGPLYSCSLGSTTASTGSFVFALKKDTYLCHRNEGGSNSHPYITDGKYRVMATLYNTTATDANHIFDLSDHLITIAGVNSTYPN